MKMEAGGRGCGDVADTTMMMTNTTTRIDRTSSIENEPRTLHINQMEYARKAALYVMNTSSTVEDALRIFTEGLEPVRRIREELEVEESRWAGDDDERFDYNYNQLMHQMHVRHTSSSGSFIKDIATAPF